MAEPEGSLEDEVLALVSKFEQAAQPEAKPEVVEKTPISAEYEARIAELERKNLFNKVRGDLALLFIRKSGIYTERFDGYNESNLISGVAWYVAKHRPDPKSDSFVPTLVEKFVKRFPLKGGADIDKFREDVTPIMERIRVSLVTGSPYSKSSLEYTLNVASKKAIERAFRLADSEDKAAIAYTLTNNGYVGEVIGGIKDWFSRAIDPCSDTTMQQSSDFGGMEESIDALINVAVIQLKNEDYVEAYKTLDSAKAMTAQFDGEARDIEDRLWTDLAIIDSELGRYDCAENAIGQIYSEYSRVSAYVDLAYIMARNKANGVEEILSQVENYLDNSIDYPIRIKLAFTYAELGDFEKARETLGDLYDDAEGGRKENALVGLEAMKGGEDIDMNEGSSSAIDNSYGQVTKLTSKVNVHGPSLKHLTDFYTQVNDMKYSDAKGTITKTIQEADAVGTARAFLTLAVICKEALEHLESS